MEAYERRMTALRSGEYLPPAEDSYDPAMDLKAHSSKHKKTPVEQESYLSKEQLQTLRKVQHERIEVRGATHEVPSVLNADLSLIRRLEK
jgi:hypothetical protein